MELYLFFIVIWHNLLFQFNKTSKVMQAYGVSVEVVEIKIKAMEEVLKKCRNNGHSSAVTCAREMAFQIGSEFAEQIQKKRAMFEYEVEEESGQM